MANGCVREGMYLWVCISGRVRVGGSAHILVSVLGGCVG